MPIDIERKKRQEAKRYREDPEFRDRKLAAAERYYERLPPEERRANRRRWRNANRERHRELGRIEQALLRQEVIVAYGGLCECCGIDFEPHLTLDHVNGGGSAERRKAPGSALFRRLRRDGFPPGYRVLCWNCNWAAHHLGRCPCSD